jgi:DNA polymerase-3 subunit beta
MKLSCLQENLTRGLHTVGRAVAGKSTLPVLSNVMLTTDNGQLKLSATNLEIGVNCWVGAKVDEEGATTIPARLLSEFINSLPPERIDLKLDAETQTLNLKCARFESNIKGIDAQEFPIVPTATVSSNAIELDPESLRASINQVVFAAATDESRPILAGVLIQFKDDTMTMAAADGFRLSVKELSLNQNLAAVSDVIVPARALMELSRISGDQEQPVEVIITPERKQILFHLKDVDLVSQLLEGRFPDYNQIIPHGYETRSVLETASLLKAVRISHLFARDAANIVKLEITPGSDELHMGRVTLVAASAELGDNVAEVDASIEGNAMEIAFNAKYLIDVLSIIDTPQVVLETISHSSPGVIHPLGDDEFKHVIMPMHISR